MLVRNAELIHLPKILDNRGNLSFFQNDDHIPFSITQVFWIYDVPGGGGPWLESDRNHQEIIIALSGSFDVIIGEGDSEKIFTLNRSHFGLFVPKSVSCQITNFSTNALALIATDLDKKTEKL